MAERSKTVLDHLAYVFAVLSAIALLIGIVFPETLLNEKFRIYRMSLVFISSIYIATISYIRKKEWYLWPFLAIAFFYNPAILPIKVDLQTWKVIDVLAALIFIFLR